MVKKKPADHHSSSECLTLRCDADADGLAQRKGILRRVIAAQREAHEAETQQLREAKAKAEEDLRACLEAGGKVRQEQLREGRPALQQAKAMAQQSAKAFRRQTQQEKRRQKEQDQELQAARTQVAEERQRSEAEVAAMRTTACALHSRMCEEGRSQGRAEADVVKAAAEEEARRILARAREEARAVAAQAKAEALTPALHEEVAVDTLEDKVEALDSDWTLAAAKGCSEDDDDGWAVLQ